MAEETAAKSDPNGGRRFLTFLKNAVVHKRRRLAGEVPFQYFEPHDVERLMKLKTVRLATEDEIRAAYLADQRNELHKLEPSQLAKPATICTGIAPDNLEDNLEDSVDATAPVVDEDEHTD